MSLAYWGSKKKLASRIADVLADAADGRTVYHEPFCGMASVGLEALPRFRTSVWSDVHADVVLYWRAVQRGWLPSTRPLTQAQWDAYRASARPSVARSFYGFHFGWGGHFLTGRTLVRDKNTEAHLRGVRERVRVAGEAMRDHRVRVEHAAYWELRPKRAVVYCDPPYVGENSGRHFRPEDMARLWDCMRVWLRDGCAVFLSASERPRAPPGLRLDVVAQWTVYNNTASINPHAPRHRHELLLRVRHSATRP